MKRIIVLCLAMLLSACVPPVVLTPEGAKIPMIGTNLAQSLPGRPLDKCRIVEHLNVSTPIQTAGGCYSQESLEAMLRNATAEKGGNAVIFVQLKNPGAHPVYGTPCAYGIQGIALQCEPETLKAAGLAPHP